jgi:phospholipid transport system substrate-binding protein
VGLLCLAAAWLAQAEVTPPRDLVISTSQKMLAKIAEQKAALDRNPRLIDTFVIDIVLPHFDFEKMARAVLGKYWQQADPGQRERFIAEFRKLLVRTYATALLEYSHQEINYLPMPPGATGDDVTVRTEINQPGGLSIPIHYRMERQESGWKVYDVAIDGVSLVNNYRTTFGGEISNQGLEPLLESMTRRNAEAHRG